MAEYGEFERIPIYYPYDYYKSLFFTKCDEVKLCGEDRSYNMVVKGVLDTFFPEDINENGMSRVALMLFAALYAIKHNELDSELATAVKWHIEDFEHGDYDSLFEEEDRLDLLKADIETVKKYLAEHPEIMTE